MIRILVVEDEHAISNLIAVNLKKAGYACDCVYDGMAAADALDNGPYDLILLDVMLPKVDGYELMSYIAPLEIPVIFLTAKSSVTDRVKGLRLGADDYLVKPSAFDELLARIRVMMRRKPQYTSNRLKIADLVLDRDTKQVWRAGKEISLSAKEFMVLECLMRNQNVVLSRSQIEQNAWNYDFEGGSNVIDVYIRYLRKTIDEGFDQKLIHTVRGAGYVMREEA